MFKEPLIRTIEMRALMIIWWVCSKKMWWSGSKVNLIFFLYSLLHSRFSSQAHSQWDFQLHALERAWGQEALRAISCEFETLPERAVQYIPAQCIMYIKCFWQPWKGCYSVIQNIGSARTALRHLRIVADRKDHLIHQFGKHWKRKSVLRRRNKKMVQASCWLHEYAVPSKRNAMVDKLIKLRTQMQPQTILLRPSETLHNGTKMVVRQILTKWIFYLAVQKK